MDKLFKESLDPDNFTQPNTDAIQRDGGLLKLRSEIQTRNGQNNYMQVIINRYSRPDELLKQIQNQYYPGYEMYEFTVENFASVEEFKKGELSRQIGSLNENSLDCLQGYLALPLDFQSLNEKNIRPDSLFFERLMQSLSIDNLRVAFNTQQRHIGLVGSFNYDTKELSELSSISDEIGKSATLHYAPDSIRQPILADIRAKQEAENHIHQESPNRLPDNSIE